jgi:hypothetical protein
VFDRLGSVSEEVNIVLNEHVVVCVLCPAERVMRVCKRDRECQNFTQALVERNALAACVRFALETLVYEAKNAVCNHADVCKWW